MTTRIDEVNLYRVRLPLVRDFETSSHKKNYIEHVLVRATSSEGLVGWGECASPSDPYFCYESTDTCWLMLERYLVPSLLGVAWEDPDDAMMHTHVNGNPFAHAGLEMACWDLHSQRLGVSLAEALGGTAVEVEAGVSLGIEATIDALLEVVALHVNDGYRRVKLKIAPGWEVEPCRQVRIAFPELRLQVDANGCFASPTVGSDVFTELDELGLLMIEQPFAPDDLLSHALLGGRLDTPICLDESITSSDAARTALALGACKIVNVKVSRLGGLSNAVRVHDLCYADGVPVWCGGMHEFGVGRAANLAVASMSGFTYPSDISGSRKYYERDIIASEIVAYEGRVSVPRGHPGLGVDVNLDRVAEHLVATTTLHHTTASRGEIQ